MVHKTKHFETVKVIHMEKTTVSKNENGSTSFVRKKISLFWDYKIIRNTAFILPQ